MDGDAVGDVGAGAAAHEACKEIEMCAKMACFTRMCAVIFLSPLTYLPLLSTLLSSRLLLAPIKLRVV